MKPFSFFQRLLRLHNLPALCCALLFICFCFHGQAQRLEWVKVIPVEYVTSTEVDRYGSYYATGVFYDTVDFDPGLGVHNLVAAQISSPWGYQTGSFILKLDPQGNFAWARKICENDSAYLASIAVDSFSNVYAVGNFQDTIDIDPGPGIHLLFPTPGTQINSFILKLDAQGNFIWVKTINGNSSAQSISLDGQGNIYIGGEFSGTVDFDPSGTGSSLTTSINASYPGWFYEQSFVLKLNSAGNFAWVRTFTGSNTLKQLNVDPTGGVYCAGTFQDTLGFGGGLFLTTSVYDNPYLCKLDNAGQTVWARTLDGYLSGASYQITDQVFTVDETGNVFNSGGFEGTVDLDPGPGVDQRTSAGATDIYIRKTDPSGNAEWSRQIGYVNWDGGVAVAVDKDGDVFNIGGYSGKVDFDPGPGVHKLKHHANYLLKLDSAGNYKWAFKQNFNCSFINTDSFGNMFVTGGEVYGGVDFDLGPGVASTNAGGWFIQKLHDDSCFMMTVSVDTLKNINCTTPQGYIGVSCTECTPPYNYSWSSAPGVNSPNLSVSTGGLHTVTITDALGCSRSLGVYVKSPSTPSAFDLDVNLIAGNFSPTQVRTLTVEAFNEGCVPKSGIVKLVLDTNVIYYNSYPPASQIIGDTLIWNVSNMVWNGTHLTAHVQVTVTPTSALLDSVWLTTIVTPVAGDADTSNNVKTYLRQVLTSMDPNDIQVYPVGFCDEHYVEPQKPLTYTIRFQNTGLEFAEDIEILDTLDAALDPLSVRLVAKSHLVDMEMLSGNVVRFLFEEINLPDSNTSEPSSQGYVTFKVKPLATVPPGTEITNSASIFFDFNPPVITNTVMNTIADSGGFPFIAVAALDHYCAIAVNQGANTAAYSYSYSNPPAFGPYASLKGLDTGTYAVTIQNATGCKVTTNAVTVPDTQIVFPVAAALLMPACHGDANGSIVMTTQGGVGPYTYLWDNGSSVTADTAIRTGLTQGQYIVQSTDLYGCHNTDTIILTDPAALADSISWTNPNCYGAANGTATLYPSGGITPYSYAWNTGFVQNTQTAVSLSAGSYSVTLTDSNGCQLTDMITLADPPPFVATIAVMDVSCSGDSTGVAIVAGAGGGAPYEFVWATNPPQYTAGIADLKAGTYLVQLTDSLGCELIDSAVVGEPQAIALTFVPGPDNGGCTGTATVLPAGGTPPYLVSWDNGGQTATITGLCSGWYEVTVTDAAGCQKTDSLLLPLVNNIPGLVGTDFVVYPNPAHSAVTVACTESGLLELIDVVGRIRRSIWLAGGTNSRIVDVSSLPAGVYSYRYKGNKTKITGKLLIY